MKNWVVTLCILSALHSTSSGKKPKQLSRVMILKIEHLGGANGGGVAWHAGQQKYYTAITGNTYYPMFMYNAEGKRLGDTTMNTMFDVRGGEYVLDNEGMPESVKKLSLKSLQPDEQSVGAYDTANKVLYFLEKNTGNIIRENFIGAADTVGLYLGIKKKRKTKGHKNSTVITKYNENACIYSGMAHKEIGLLNAREKQIELYSAETGLLKKIYKLPPDAPLEYSLNFSYSNGIYWLFDKKKREWRGYQ